MILTCAAEGQEYIVRQIATDDPELDAFLFSLGCYSGEPSCVISIKDGRYTIDRELASAIEVQ